jgi:hypothetical protein
MKYLILFSLLFSCSPKKPEVPKTEAAKVTVYPGACYRYPNVKMEDIHVKVIRTYDKGGFYGEFIHNKTYFNYIHDLSTASHVKEIDCQMYDDLKSISKPWSNG